MKSATFSEGVIIALVSSIAVAAIFTVMSSLFFNDELLKLLISGVSFFYIGYLFLRSKERTGRVTIISIWFVITLSSLFLMPSLLMFIVTQLLIIWLMRSLYFYNSIFSSITDLVLTGLSLVIAIWAWFNSGSLFLTFWSFFLTQALFVFIPKSFTKENKSESDVYTEQDKFEHAHHLAETAVSKLINSK